MKLGCGGIWYQEYFELGSWENFSLLLLWEKKGDLKTVFVCVWHILCQMFSKTLELTQMDFILAIASVIYDSDFL